MATRRWDGDLSVDGTITSGGPVVLPAAAPTSPQHAASKDYVDQNSGSVDTNNIMGYVHHGTVASTPRPDVSGGVIWVGSVAPSNKLPGDFWFYPNGVPNDYLSLAGYSEQVTKGNATGTYTFNVGVRNVYDVLLTGNVTVALTAPPSSTEAWSLTIIARQDATGGRVMTWPSSVKWPEGVTPTADGTANVANIWALTTTDGGATWYGFLSGKGMA